MINLNVNQALGNNRIKQESLSSMEINLSLPH